MEKAKDSNIDRLEQLASGSEGELAEAAQHLVSTHPEPEVLHYIVEAIMEEDEEEPGFRDESMAWEGRVLLCKAGVRAGAGLLQSRRQ
jgi:hypothetical protein